MNYKIPKISGYEQLKKLRTALAISRGTKLLSILEQEAEATVSHDQTKRVTYLTNLFSRIHREMFHDWRKQATVSQRPGTMTDPDKRKAFRETVEQLVTNGEGNQESAVFDNNGFVIGAENISERLADFYRKMRGVRPFSFGNRITLDFFMTALGRLPAFKAVYEHGIDFRRLEPADAAALHDPRSTHREIDAAFRHAMDPTRNKNLRNPPNGYGRWPENKKFVSGIPFLSHKTEAGIECLVTVNGGLFPVADVREELFVEGRHLADYPLPDPDKIIGYLPGTEELRSPGKKDIDGIPVGPDGAAPLFCLDVNLMTGLRSPSHAELIELIGQCEGSAASFFSLADNERLKNKLLDAAKGDVRLTRTVEIAYDRLGKIVKKLDKALISLFEGTAPVDAPALFMAMGGAGTGKTIVEEMARARCGGNFVTASLDEFRKQSDHYTVLTAADHHSDDYVYVEPFANRLRDLVASRARECGVNLLYDGTGIPYNPRYSGIIRQFKEAGFHTQIVAMDAFIALPKDSGNRQSHSAIIARVKDRFKETGRALPWVVTVYKHVRAPRSFLNALEDWNLDKISLFANDAEMGGHYLVAESFPLSDEEISQVHRRQLSGGLEEYYRAKVGRRSDSVLSMLAGGKAEAVDALLEKNPGFDETNVAYQIYSFQNEHRILAIYNTGRMADFMEKRQLNPYASGEEGLLHKNETLEFHVDPLGLEPWLIRLQGASLR
ncbi:MAG: zeta toxin family protein [Gammaproteobacteria bacterium]